MGLVAGDDGWRVPDELWERIQPLLPQGVSILGVPGLRC